MSRRNVHSDTEYLVKELGFTPEEAAVSQREDELAAAFEIRLAREKAELREAIAKGLETDAAERERLAAKRGAAFSDIANWQRKMAASIRSGEIG